MEEIEVIYNGVTLVIVGEFDTEIDFYSQSVLINGEDIIDVIDWDTRLELEKLAVNKKFNN